MASLVEIDTLEAIIIIDNELDPMSHIAPSTVKVSGQLADVGIQGAHIHSRGDAIELPMEALCCGAFGLSVLLVATKGEKKHAMLFDCGPEGEAWERNATRLGIDLSTIEVVQLSHWHRDHSGGMLKAVQMISTARKEQGLPAVLVDLHPDRPAYRGFKFGERVVSFAADPSFSEIEAAGGKIQKKDEGHTVLENFFHVSGYIPRVAMYETGLRNGVQFFEKSGKWEVDEAMADERFLMCNLKGKGIVVFTGCSHRGVVNASREAFRLMGGRVPLHAILGGYHLAMNDEARVQGTVKDLKALNPSVLLPGHCSGWRVKFEIEKEMPGKLVPCTVGSRISF